VLLYIEEEDHEITLFMLQKLHDNDGGDDDSDDKDGGR
jgi:hypothetical protein